MSILKRARSRTPKFFKILRNIGLSMATLGGCILTAPMHFPTIVLTISGYLTVAGGVLSAVSQLTTHSNDESYGN